MHKFERIQKPPLNVIGIECRTSNALQAGPIDIPKHWEKFYKEGILGKIPNKTSDEVIALYYDYEGDYTQPYSLIIGCFVNSTATIPEGMIGKTVSGGTYALFHAVGEHPKALIETWSQIWKHPNLNRTYTGDYEVYGAKFAAASPKEVDVFIAIKS